MSFNPENYLATIQIQWEVSFYDPEKAKEFFIESDWKDYFFEFENLDKAAEHLALAFHLYPEQWSKSRNVSYRSPEGFGDFYKVPGKQVYIMAPTGKDGDDAPGAISITLKSDDYVESIGKL